MSFVYLASSGDAVLDVATDLAKALVRSGDGIRVDDVGAWRFDTVTNGDSSAAEHVALSSSTPVTIDLRDLSGRSGVVGDTTFARVTALVIRNVGSYPVTVGNAASASFQADLSTGATYTLRAGEFLAIRYDDATAFDLTSTYNLKLDPGANDCEIVYGLKGNAT